jgi:hypothetical protein
MAPKNIVSRRNPMVLHFEREAGEFTCKMQRDESATRAAANVGIPMQRYGRPGRLKIAHLLPEIPIGRRDPELTILIRGDHGEDWADGLLLQQCMDAAPPPRIDRRTEIVNAK